MKKVKIKIGTKDLMLAPEDKKKTPAELFCATIESIMMGHVHQQKGLGEKDRRTYYKILDKLETVKKTDAVMELEDSHYHYIMKCKKETKMMPNKLLKRVETIVILNKP